ncbi:MAG: hypothetical protein ACPIOQ_75915, partial [Promethearchaeia archaeon]
MAQGRLRAAREMVALGAGRCRCARCLACTGAKGRDGAAIGASLATENPATRVRLQAPSMHSSVDTSGPVPGRAIVRGPL